MKINKLFIITLMFFVFFVSAEACVDCDTYIFLTAAIDGPSFDANGSYIYLNPCTIDVDGVTKTGIPGAAFEVTSNKVHIITYSKEGYVTDKDDIFIDSRIRNCGVTCHYEYCHFITECEYRSQKDDWVCVATDTQTSQHITFVYTTHYPGLDETVLFINPMYPGECIPGHTEQRQCGYSNVGECEYGIQERVCQQDLYWGSYGSCIGAVYPAEEICDGKDNDCDGLIDEGGVCWECTTDNDCNHLDNDYCECSYKVMHDEGKCINHECTAQTTEVQNCNDLDEYYCDNTNIMFDDYWCLDAECVIKSTDLFEECDNGLFCDGQETCKDAQCFPGTQVDCSDYNIEGIETCNYCDSNPLTWDYRAEFISTCNEDTDSCEVGDDIITHECSVDNCEAECDATHSCADTECSHLNGCVGSNYYSYQNVPNVCLGDCTCEQNECGEPEISYNDSRCFACTPGEQEIISCYEGPEGTEGIGICTSGTKTRTCDSEGQWGSWGSCVGVVYPAEEICDGLDNDCDGLVDEDGVCNICVPGEQQTRQCGLTDVGECEYGIQTRTCVCGQYWTDWSECTGAVYPAEEICDELDNDCDGLIDEDEVCDICVPGEQQTRQCGLTDVGECSYGTKTRTCVCGQYWSDWSECTGAVYPTEEICDELDNDCDGEIDEGGVCDTPIPDMNSVLGITRFSIINDDYLHPGDSIMILVTLENNGNTNLKDIQLTLVVPELDIRKRVGPFDLKKNQEITKLIILDIPYWAEPGYYDIRATASNGDVRRVKHREIIIHN